MTKVSQKISGGSEVLNAFTGALAHQMSQPVMGIHGFIQFLKSATDPASPQYRPLTLIEEQSDYLKRLLEDIKTLLHHQALKKERIQLHEPIQKAMYLCEDYLIKRRLKCQMTSDPSVVIEADSVYLEKVFINIILNFSRSNKAGELTITVKEDQSKIKIMVKGGSFSNDKNYILALNKADLKGMNLYKGALQPFKGKATLEKGTLVFQFPS